MKVLRVIAVLAGLGTLVACSARKTYPDTAPGWHSADYSLIFGRLQRVPPPISTPDAPAAWTIRYGQANDTYRGELALTPADRFVGYVGGERVEVRGHLLNEPTNDQYNGRWYAVDSIRMWEGHR